MYNLGLWIDIIAPAHISTVLAIGMNVWSYNCTLFANPYHETSVASQALHLCALGGMGNGVWSLKGNQSSLGMSYRLM